MKLFRTCRTVATVASYIISVAFIVGVICTWPAILHLGWLYRTYLERKQLVEEFFQAADNFDRKAQPWEECSVELPNGSGRFVFLRQHIHPFLAEYDRKIRFETEHGATNTAWLRTNVGGRTKVNVYWYPADQEEGPFVRLQDHWGEHILDFRRSVTRLVSRMQGAAYIGDMAGPDTGSGWQRRIGAEREETEFLVGTTKNEKVTGLLASGSGLYVGRIDGSQGPLRFVPASESPEETIQIHD